jgi:hypothetical protein
MCVVPQSWGPPLQRGRGPAYHQSNPVILLNLPADASRICYRRYRGTIFYLEVYFLMDFLHIPCSRLSGGGCQSEDAVLGFQIAVSPGCNGV